MYNAPVFDLTTCIEVDDIFSGRGIGEASWRRKAIADFVDVCVYGAKPGYFAPLKHRDQLPKEVQTVALVREMAKYKDLELQPIAYPAYDQPELKEEDFKDFFTRFASWLCHHQHESDRGYNVRQWLETQARYRASHEDRIPGGVLFPYKRFSQKSQRLLEGVARSRDFFPAEMEYAFDVCYRRLLYEPLTPRGEHYIHHPLRDACTTDDIRFTQKSSHLVPISFRHWAQNIAPNMRMAEFVEWLVRIKEALHNSPIIDKMNHEITKGEVRDLAFSVRFPATLKMKYMRILDDDVLFGTTAIGAAATILEWSKSAGMLVLFGGAAVTYAVNRWKGRIPEFALGREHLKFALSWPELENQVMRQDGDD